VILNCPLFFFLLFLFYFIESALETIDLGHQLLIAGFVNAHTHAGMTHMRGMAEDLHLADWLATEVTNFYDILLLLLN
jgi:cytosine/adenosine deaminase-related metal-dependent hydrolase